MKIEKISETQVKFVLTNEDFNNRGLSIAELTYNSDKAQALLKDMLEMAAAETGFTVNQSPLMIEAVPMIDSIMIIVSKISEKPDGALPSPLTSLFGRLTRKELLEGAQQPEFKSLQSGGVKNVRVPKNIAIYSFDSIDDVSCASLRMRQFFRGASSLHKYRGKYFICIQLPYKTASAKMGALESILCEYGEKHVSNVVSRGFLLEHGEMIINSDAINKLAAL